MARNLTRHHIAKILPHHVPPEGQRQASFAKPPFAEILDEMQTVVCEGELAFVDQKPDVDSAVDHRLLDLIEWRHHRLEVWLEESKREIRTRQLPRNRDALAAHVGA